MEIDDETLSSNETESDININEQEEERKGALILKCKLSLEAYGSSTHQR